MKSFKNRILGVAMLIIIVIGLLLVPKKTKAEMEPCALYGYSKAEVPEAAYLEACELLTAMISNKDIIDVPENEEVYLGNPVTVFWIDDNCECDFYRYYYPVIYSNKVIKSIVILEDVDENGNIIYWAQSISDTVEELNYLNQIDDFNAENLYLVAYEEALYGVNDKITVDLTNQNPNVNNMISEKSETILNSIHAVKDSADFILLSEYYRGESIENVEEILYEKGVTEMDPNLYSYKGGVRVFFAADGYGSVQGADGACWAACVATIANYRLKTTVYRDRNIYDIFEGELEYPDGPRPYQIRDALRICQCGIYETKSSDEKKIKDSIDSDYPVILKGKAKDVNMSGLDHHMFTIYGYDESSMYYWDPKDGSYGVARYNQLLTTKGYKNSTFSWEDIYIKGNYK